MKPARRDTAQNDECVQLSARFAKAGWALSDQNFRERPFVIWHGSFYSVSGTPPNGSPCSKACQTAEEVLAFLEANSAGTARREAITPITIAAPASAADRSKADGEEIARLRARIAELESRPPEVREVEKIVERVVEVPMLSPNPVRHMIPDEIRNLMQEGESLSSAKRRLTELLWVEQAELRNLRATDRENLKREAEIERLLGLFARLGEI